MFNLMSEPRRAPFSDWLAQVDRRTWRKAGFHVVGGNALAYLQSCYDVGLTPIEVADDLIKGC